MPGGADGVEEDGGTPVRVQWRRCEICGAVGGVDGTRGARDPETLDGDGGSGGCCAAVALQALELLDELDRLAGFERRVRELVGEMRRVALGRQGQDGRAPE